MVASIVASRTAKRTKVACAVLALAAVLGKRYNRNAKVIWLVKRLIGFFLGKVLPMPIPRVISGAGSLSDISTAVKQVGCKKPLVVTDEALVRLGAVKPCLDALEAAGMAHSLFDAVVPNPPSELVDAGFAQYTRDGCDCLIAFGGGSPMDTAKVIGAKVCNPQPNIEAYQGYFNVNKFGFAPLPPLIAVPTTAGTGSETTVAAIITLKKENRKIMIADLGLVPSVAVLDPQVLAKLPKHITAATGMDALTHAVESFIGGWSTAYTRKMSLSATEKIFKQLMKSYSEGGDLKAREDMLNASFEAGLAFTRANVGYVHAIAHQFGGMFHTPHGDANAMLLPHVLSFYLENDEPGLLTGRTPTTDLLAQLAAAAGLAPAGGTAAERRAAAEKFVARIREMNAEMGISSEVKGMQASQVSEVATRALMEAHGTKNSFLALKSYMFDLGYPVPRYMTHAECAAIVAKVLPTEERRAWHNGSGH